MTRMDLDGKWQFRRTRNWEAWLDATVPGCVHTDLLANGLIDDPFAGANELDLLWIDQAGWEYRRTFDVPAAALAEAGQQLVFEGLDTVAAVFLNGRRLGRTDNMFRRWTFDVTGGLKRCGNRLLVRFTGPVAEARRLDRRRGPAGRRRRPARHRALRRPSCRLRCCHRRVLFASADADRPAMLHQTAGAAKAS